MSVCQNGAAEYGSAAGMDSIMGRQRQIHTSSGRPAPVSKQFVEQETENQQG